MNMQMSDSQLIPLLNKKRGRPLTNPKPGMVYKFGLLLPKLRKDSS